MKTLVRVVTCCVVVALGLWVLTPKTAFAQQATGLRRFALVVGANNGGAARVTLRYATHDARSVATVLQQLGGLASTDQRVLIDPTAADVLSALDGFSPAIAQARAAGQRVEFVFYYSGHSDEQGLLLREERIGYSDVRGRLGALSSDVRIAVLDSCASGSLTRMKGGQHQAPFLIDASTDVRGHAFLTSSSADEAAQESDRIGASFFTHYLVSGLRGAADFNGDQRVTLNEAYRFAFDETLRRTEATQGGAQHPSYDIQLAGTGDLVMTDLRQTSSTLAIERGLEARIYVRDASRQLVAELYKPAGRVVELAMEPGTYEIVADRGGALFRASVELRQGQRTELTAASLTPMDAERTVARGADAEDAAVPGANVAPETTPERGVEIDGEGYRVLPLAMSLWPPIDTNSIEPRRKVVNYFAFNWILGRSDRIHGLQLGLGANWAVDRVNGVQMTVAANWLEGELHGAQISSGLNYVGGDGRGLQLSMVNVSSDLFTGAQIGMINVASGRVRGVQLGMINYADEADVSIGLLTLTRKGGVHPIAWTSNSAAFNVGLRFDANYSYTFVAVGGHPAGEGAAAIISGGFGLKLPIEANTIWLDMDMGHSWVGYEGSFREGAMMSSARVMLRVQLAERFGIYAGPSFHSVLNIGTTDNGRRPGYGPVSYHYHRPSDPRVDLVLFPGFTAGLIL